MKKLAGIFIAILIVGYFVNSYLENKAKHEAEKAKKEKIKQEKIETISQMVSQTNAIKDWDKKLSKGKKFRADPILTLELEKLWLKDRPILFLGSIKDISTLDESKYEILVERSIIHNTDYLFADDLQLSLISQKRPIDSLMDKHPELFEDFGVNNGVAVIANIDSIRNKNILGEDGEREVLKIGSGELINIEYLGTTSL